MRWFVLAALLVIASATFAQPFDTIVAGNAGVCVPFEPAIGRSLEFTGAATFTRTNVAAVAPGPNGRVFAAVVSGDGFFVAEVRLDRTLLPISSTVSGLTPFAMVVDRDGRIHVLAGKVRTLDYAIVSFSLEGSIRSIFPLIGVYFTGQYGYGSWHLAESSIDLASDQCTLFLIEDATLIRRFDVCTGKFGPDFALLHPSEAYALRVLPDGGLIVAGQDQAGYALMRYTPTGQVSQRFPVDFFVHALMLRDGGARVVYGEQDCQYGKLVTLDLATGQAQEPRLTMDTPTSIVSYFGWTAALGAAHLPDAPVLGFGGIGLVALALIGIALLRLR